MLNPALLGAAFVAGVGPTDALGIAGWFALGSPFVTWTIANVKVDPLGGTPLVAAAGIVGGTGALTVGPSEPLGLLLAATALTIDATGIEKWLTVADHYASHLASSGGVDPTLLVPYAGPAPPATGPVTGTGLLSLAADFDFAGALNVTDAPGIEKWRAVGSALRTHLELGLVTPTMTSPVAAGPLAGSGVIS